MGAAGTIRDLVAFWTQEIPSNGRTAHRAAFAADRGRFASKPAGGAARRSDIGDPVTAVSGDPPLLRTPSDGVDRARQTAGTSSDPHDHVTVATPIGSVRPLMCASATSDAAVPGASARVVADATIRPPAASAATRAATWTPTPL
jgi:hypothetical protein